MVAGIGLVAAADYVQGGAVQSGVLVVGVAPGSPAASAGLVGGDVITGLAGRAITSQTALTNTLLAKKPGEAVRIAWVDRLGSAHTATVTLMSGPPQ